MINIKTSTMSIEHGEGKVELIPVKRTRQEKIKDNLCWMGLNLLVVAIFLGLFGLVLLLASPVHAEAPPQPSSYTLLVIATDSDGRSSQSTFPGYPTFNTCADASEELLRQKINHDAKHGGPLTLVLQMYCVPSYIAVVKP